MNKLFRAITTDNNKTYLLSDGNIKDSTNQISIKPDEVISITLDLLAKKDNKIGSSLIRAVLSYKENIKILDISTVDVGEFEDDTWDLGLEIDTNNNCCSIFIKAEEQVKCVASIIHLLKI
jgi:hypothetical protein